MKWRRPHLALLQRETWETMPKKFVQCCNKTYILQKVLFPRRWSHPSALADYDFFYSTVIDSLSKRCFRIAQSVLQISLMIHFIIKCKADQRTKKCYPILLSLQEFKDYMKQKEGRKIIKLRLGISGFV